MRRGQGQRGFGAVGVDLVGGELGVDIGKVQGRVRRVREGVFGPQKGESRRLRLAALHNN